MAKKKKNDGPENFSADDATKTADAAGKAVDDAVRVLDGENAIAKA